MTDDHSRYERLAVGHVLGGLDSVDAAAFRSHLLGCRECRLRVSELRGIASDLAAAEREERATAASRLATEVERRAAEEIEPQAERVEPAPWQRWPWGVVGVATLVAGLIMLLVWNLGLRTTNDVLVGVTEQRETVLRVLAEGELLDTTFGTGGSGLVAADDAAVVVDVAGLAELAPQELAVVWQLDAAGDTLERSATVTASQVRDGRLALAVARADGFATLAVSVEQAPLQVQDPTGLRLLTASSGEG